MLEYASTSSYGNASAHPSPTRQEKPLPKEKTPDKSFNAWLEEMTATELRIWTLACYCAGVALYSAFGMIVGYSFWRTCAVFVGTAFSGVITYFCTGVYSIYAGRRVFGSYNSWFMRFHDFLEDDFEQFLYRLTAITDMWNAENIYVKTMAIILFLPMFGLAIGMVAALEIFILALDWMRLIAIGCANISLFLVPYHPAVGFTLGAMASAAMSRSLDQNILFSFYAFWMITGGMAGMCASLYKELRKRKYGKPYFQT